MSRSPHTARKKGVQDPHAGAHREGPSDAERIAALEAEIERLRRENAERKQVEEALKEAHTRTNDTLESIRDGFFSLDRDWRFTFINRQAAEIDGLRPEQLLGRNIWEAYPRLIGTRLETVYRRVMQDRVPEHFEQGGLDADTWYEIRVYPTGDGGISVCWLDKTAQKRAEEALQDREERFRLLFENMQEALFVFEPVTDTDGCIVDGRYVEVNAAAERFVGKTRAALIGRTTVGVLGGAPPEVSRDTFRRVARTGEPVRYVEYSRRLDRWYETFTYAPQPGRVAMLVLDITERKQAEEALRESEAKYRNLVDLSPDAIILEREGVITYANPAALRLYGAATLEDLTEKNRLKFVHPEYRAIVEARIRELREKGYISPLEIQIVRLDGATVDAETTGSLMHIDGVPHGQIVMRDITKRKRAEADLRAALEKEHLRATELDATLASIASGVIIYDSTGSIVRINDAVQKMISRISPSLDRIHFEKRMATFGVLRPEGTPLPQEATPYYRALRGETVQGEEVMVTRLGREPLWVNTSAAPIRDDRGAIVGAIAILTDITERKRAEEALKEYAQKLQRSNEDLERFAYISSHDLQEPLRTMVTFTQLLEKRYRSQLDTDADEYLHYIVGAGKRMQTLINDLLEFARVNTKGGDFHPTDATAVVEDALAFIHSKTEENGATITHDPLPRVIADANQLRQVFQNLVSNAIKFRRPDVPPAIHISAQRQDGMVRFSVTDNGIGIEPQYYDRIFVIFQRLHGMDAYEGTGIGLAIVKRIIDRHKGRIWVESEPGKGSTFYFTVPAVK